MNDQERYPVAVYCPTEADQVAAAVVLQADPQLDAVRQYQGVATTWCSPAQLRALHDAGLPTALLAPPPGPPGGRTPPEEGGFTSRSTRGEHDELVQRMRTYADRVAISEETPGFVLTAQEGQFRESRNDMYLVRLACPLDAGCRAWLAALGVSVTAFEPPDDYGMYLDPVQRDAVAAQSWVRDLRPWGLARSLTEELIAVVSPDGGTEPAGPDLPDAGTGGLPAAPDQFDVLLFRAEDTGWLRSTLDGSPRTTVLFAGGEQLRFRTELRGEPLHSLLAAVARLHEVRTVTPYRAPTLYVDRGRQVIGLDRLEAGTPGRWTGAGESVAILDSGIDVTHPDLADRITVKQALVGSTPDDLLGHGTHVAGIIAGNGQASAGKITGCAPGASLAVFRITDDDGRVQVPPDIGPFLQHAVDAGAKIINLSWGNAMSGAYDTYSASLDQFAYGNPEVLVVVAAGNDGQAPEGSHLFNTVGTPATAKNAVTVGACDSDRAEFAGQTWGELRRARFPSPPAGDEHVCGDPDLPAAISSRGPTDAGSVKPDLIAPGTYVLATRLGGAAIDRYLIWQECADFDNRYVYSGGTSMAAPMVAGAAAVLRQFLAQERDCPQPSAALLRALLIAATRRLPSIRPAGSWQDVGYPDFDQGFGRLDLAAVLPCPSAPPDRRIAFVDVRNNAPEALEAYAPVGAPRRSSRAYQVTVAGTGDPLRIALAWTDRPGAAVQNNLNVTVTDPAGRLLAGNAGHRYQKQPGFDRDGHDPTGGVQLDRLNTVELVTLDAPPPGEYLIRVLAQNTTFPGQGYALVVCGQLDSDLVVQV